MECINTNVSFDAEELNLIRQWINSLNDIVPSYFNNRDRDLACKIIKGYNGEDIGPSSPVINLDKTMCGYCKEEQNIFEFETLDSWILGWGGGSITEENASYSKDIVFIDRGFLRLVDSEDCQCLDHGEKIKINYCPFCGTSLST